MKEIIIKSPKFGIKIILVDDADFEHVNKHKWHVSKRSNNIYAGTHIKGMNVLLHHFITNEKYIDHIDGDGLNNQRNNLRKATHQQNNMNRKKQEGFSSKFKGVSWFKRDKKWRAQIQHNHKNMHIGYSIDESIAGILYDINAIALQGEFAKTNFGNPAVSQQEKLQQVA